MYNFVKYIQYTFQKESSKVADLNKILAGYGFFIGQRDT